MKKLLMCSEIKLNASSNDHLVAGNSNFDNGSLNSLGKYHYLFDVIPYIIWVNSELDDSELLERIIWEYDSRFVTLVEYLDNYQILSNVVDILFFGYTNHLIDSLFRSPHLYNYRYNDLYSVLIYSDPHFYTYSIFSEQDYLTLTTLL